MSSALDTNTQYIKKGKSKEVVEEEIYLLFFKISQAGVCMCLEREAVFRVITFLISLEIPGL